MAQRLNFCPECGSQLRLGVKFCSQCGKMEGDWDEERTSMDVYSVNSDLNCKINRFVIKDGFDYALGTVYNVDNEIGQVTMIRATP